MALHEGASTIYGVGRVVATDSVGKSKGSGHQSVKPLLKVNGQCVTAHNRKYTSSVGSVEKTVKLSSGNNKRFYSRSTKKFSLSFSYLPDKSSMTVDGYTGRDDLFNLASAQENVLVEYLPDYTSDTTDFSYQHVVCMVNAYTEALLRRDESNGCYYYNVSISFEEL